MASVHVVALAARTPVGLRAESSAAGIRAGISRVQEHPYLVDADGEPVLCGVDTQIDEKLGTAERLVALAHSALDEVVEKLALRGPIASPVPILIALPEARPGFTRPDEEAVERALARYKTKALAKPSVRCVGRGHAGASLGLEQALALLDRGMMELAIVGGVDSYLDGPTLDWLEDRRLLSCAAVRSGFPPGEGASMIALASAGVRRSLGLPSLGVLRGVARKQEPQAADPEAEPLGKGMTAAFEGLRPHLRPQELFHELYADINGERGRTTELAFALLRTTELFRDGTSYFTAVDCVGDQGAATVPLHCVLAATAWNKGYAAGANAVVCAASWAGERAAVFLGGPGG